MEKWISIHSRGHSDYRLTGDLHAPLQRVEHVFILFFFSPLSSVLLWPGAADTRVSNRAEHRRDEARGALIMNGWHWWCEKERQKVKREPERKRELWLKGLFVELFNASKTAQNLCWNISYVIVNTSSPVGLAGCASLLHFTLRATRSDLAGNVLQFFTTDCFMAQTQRALVFQCKHG